MLVFFIIITILILLVLLCSEIAIEIENLKIANGKKLSGNSSILIFLFNKKILKIKIDNNTANKIITSEKINIQNINFKSILESAKFIFSNKIEIKKIALDVRIGTGDVLITTYAVAIISTILSCILPLYIEKLKKSNYSVLPIYEDSLSYEIDLNSIIAIKTVHIIHIIYLNIKKRRDEKYDRTSNRKSYAGSYE